MTRPCAAQPAGEACPPTPRWLCPPTPSTFLAAAFGPDEEWRRARS